MHFFKADLIVSQMSHDFVWTVEMFTISEGSLSNQIQDFKRARVQNCCHGSGPGRAWTETMQVWALCVKDMKGNGDQSLFTDITPHSTWTCCSFRFSEGLLPNFVCDFTLSPPKVLYRLNCWLVYDLSGCLNANFLPDGGDVLFLRNSIIAICNKPGCHNHNYESKWN